MGDTQDAHRKPGATRRKPKMVDTARATEQAKAIEGLKRRREAALAAQKVEVQVPSSMPATSAEVEWPSTRAKAPQVTRTVERIPPGTGLRMQGTPAVETSILALANFKRRPRQPSILQNVEPDLEDNDDDDEIEDFQPDDESTPFLTSKSISQVQVVPSSPPLSASSSSESLPVSSSRKRKLTPLEVQVPRSSPPEARSSPATERQSTKERPSSIIQDDDHEALPQQLESHHNRELTPKIWSDTMAPPLSSSPSQQSPHSLRLSSARVRSAASTAQTKRKQPSRNPTTKPTDDNNNDNHEDPSNPSPTTRNKRPTKPPKTRQPLSTATLQSMLPRRRRRAPLDAFDIPSSDAELDTTTTIALRDADDDELAHLPANRLGARKRPAEATARLSKVSPKKRSTTAAAAAAKKSASSVAKKATATATAAATATKTRTYTRHRRLSDKENNIPNPRNASLEDANHAAAAPSSSPLSSPADDGTSEGIERRGEGRGRGEELKTAAKKFRLVDRWELEFEEVTASSSSPWDAR